MTVKNIIIALLIVFALGGVANQTSWIGGDRPLSRTVNRFAKWGLRWALWSNRPKLFRDEVGQCEPREVQQGEVDHRSAL